MSTAGNWNSLHPSSRSLDYHADKGFTLIELTVVLTLISIVFFFSIPKLQNDILSDPSQKASRWLLANIRSLKERAFRERKDFILNVDIDSHELWMSERITDSEQEGGAPPKSAGRYRLPEGVRILDVEFPEDVAHTSGVMEVMFYAKGYSDSAFIHLEDDRGRRRSFLIEPFLPMGRLYDDYVGFEQ